MQSLEKITVALTLLALVGLSLWLDATFDPSNIPREATPQPKGEDYYIEGVRISGRDDNGIDFSLIAQRQHRDAENDPAILERPRITQFDEQHGKRETSAEHGEIKELSEFVYTSAGTFETGETITGAASGATTSVVTVREDIKTVSTGVITGTFTVGECIVGGTSGYSARLESATNRSVLILTGNVRIVQEKTTDRPNTKTSTDRLTIRLASKG